MLAHILLTHLPPHEIDYSFQPASFFFWTLNVAAELDTEGGKTLPRIPLAGDDKNMPKVSVYFGLP